MSRRSLSRLAPDDEDLRDTPWDTQEVGSLSPAELNVRTSARRTAGPSALYWPASPSISSSTTAGSFAAYSPASPSISSSTTAGPSAVYRPTSPSALSSATAVSSTYAARRTYNVPRGSPPLTRSPTSSSYRQPSSRVGTDAAGASTLRLAPDFASGSSGGVERFGLDDIPYRVPSSQDTGELSTNNLLRHNAADAARRSSSSFHRHEPQVISPTDPNYLVFHYLIERKIIDLRTKDDTLQMVYKEHDGYKLHRERRMPPGTQAYSSASEPQIPMTVTRIELVFHPFLPVSCHDDPVEKIASVVRKYHLPIQELIIRVFSHRNRREEPEISDPGRPRLGFKTLKRLWVIGEGLGLRRLFEQIVDAQAWEVRWQRDGGVTNPVQVEEIYLKSTFAGTEETKGLQEYVKLKLPGTTFVIQGS